MHLFYLNEYFLCAMVDLILNLNTYLHQFIQYFWRRKHESPSYWKTLYNGWSIKPNPSDIGRFFRFCSIYSVTLERHIVTVSIPILCTFYAKLSFESSFRLKIGWIGNKTLRISHPYFNEMSSFVRQNKVKLSVEYVTSNILIFNNQKRL